MNLDRHNEITKGIRYDFVYAGGTYSGVMCGTAKRLAEDKESFLNYAKTTMGKLSSAPFVIVESCQKNFPNVLNPRVCMAELVNDTPQKKSFTGSEIGVVWFDDGTKDIVESLKEVLPKIDWKTSRDFDY